MFESLTLKNLAERQIRVIRQPTSTRPIIRLVEDNAVHGIVKDFSVNGFMYRNLVGRFILWRESRSYLSLRGVEGVPVFYRRIDGLALVISRVPGKDLEHLSEEERPSLEFFQKLSNLIEECHSHGVAHCDLKRLSNLMIDELGNPYIVDWAAAILDREFSVCPLKMIYQRFIDDDRKAITKLKIRFCPEAVSDEEIRNYEQRGMTERAIRVVRDFARKCLQKVA